MAMTDRMNEIFTTKMKRWTTVASINGREDLADDAVQNAYIDLVRWAPEFKDDDPVRLIAAYFQQAVANRAKKDSMREAERLDHEGLFIQGQAGYEGFEQEEVERPELGDDSMVRTIDDMIDIEKALTWGAITEREYDVFISSTVVGQTQTEIAERLGITQGRVSQLYTAANEKLYTFMNGGAE